MKLLIISLIVIVIIIIIIHYILKEKKINIFIYNELSDEILTKISEFTNIKKIENFYYIKNFSYKFIGKLKKLDEFILNNSSICYLYPINYKIPGCLFLYTDNEMKSNNLRINDNTLDFFKNLTHNDLLNLSKYIPEINILTISQQHLNIIKSFVNILYDEKYLNYIDYIKLKIQNVDYISYLTTMKNIRYPLFYNYYISNVIIIPEIDTSNYSQLCDYLNNNIIQFEYDQLIKRNEINNDYLMYITNTFKKQIDYSKILQLYSKMKENFDKWLCSRYKNYISYLNNKVNGIKITKNNQLYYYIWNEKYDEIFNYGINKIINLSENLPKTYLKDNILYINPKKTESLCYIEPEDIIGILINGNNFILNSSYINREKIN